MKAVVLDRVTAAKDVKVSEVPVPAVKPGWLLVKIMAFGMNHSEQVLRTEEIAEKYIKKPVIPGIECVGVVADAGDTQFAVGQKVCALMGGMGRTFDGSYAEYALLPEHHVFSMDTDLAWADAAAVPETYFTAWGSLFECLRLVPADKLLVRGGTCALGYAAIQLAKALGCGVIATTHRESKFDLLREMGADEIVLDDGHLTGKIRGATKALDLVGPKSLSDTLTAVEKGGIVCNTGILGGVYTLDGFDPIKDIPNGVYLTGFFSNYPTQDVMDEIFGFIKAHSLVPQHGPIYPFANVKGAILAQDTGKANGKIIVEVIH